jgi:hypothetical protein
MSYATGTVESDLTMTRFAQWSIALPISVALTFVVLASAGVSAGVLRQTASTRFPDKAAAYIQSHTLPGPLYNSYDWGGYLIWRLPKMPVSIDGRANLYGDARVTRAAMTWMGSANWADDAELIKAGTILIERGCALSSILRSDSRFQLVYEDNVASVFQPANRNRGPL